MSKTMKGTLMTLIAGIAWGLSGVSGQYLMVHGFSAIELTNLRLLFLELSLFFFPTLQIRRSFWPLPKINLPTFPFLFCLLGLLLTQLTYLEAIAETNAGTATVLQYLCPVGILAYTCIMDKVAPTLAEVFSMLLAIGGTFLIATHGQLNQLAINPKGLAWGVVSAFAYALYIILPLNLIQNGEACW